MNLSTKALSLVFDIISRSVHVLLLDFASLLLSATLCGIPHSGRREWRHSLLRKSMEPGKRERS